MRNAIDGRFGLVSPIFDRLLFYYEGRLRGEGSVYPLFKPGGVTINPTYLSTDDKLYSQFGALQNKPVFGPIEARRELLNRFASIDGSGLTDADLAKYRSIRLVTIVDGPIGTTKIMDALRWMEQQIDGFGTSSRSIAS